MKSIRLMIISFLGLETTMTYVAQQLSKLMDLFAGFEEEDYDDKA